MKEPIDCPYCGERTWKVSNESERWVCQSCGVGGGDGYWTTCSPIWGPNQQGDVWKLVPDNVLIVRCEEEG